MISALLKETFVLKFNKALTMQKSMDALKLLSCYSKDICVCSNWCYSAGQILKLGNRTSKLD